MKAKNQEKFAALEADRQRLRERVERLTSLLSHSQRQLEYVKVMGRKFSEELLGMYIPKETRDRDCTDMALGERLRFAFLDRGYEPTTETWGPEDEENYEQGIRR